MGAGMEAESIRVDFLDLEVTITHFGRRSALKSVEAICRQQLLPLRQRGGGESRRRKK